MPLNNYAVLKGRPIHNRLGTSGSPHYQVQVSTGDDNFRIAINVRSQDGSEVEYIVRPHFEHPITAGLAPLEPGLHPLESKPGGVALDFIRGNLAQRAEFVPLPMSTPGLDNDLNEKIDGYVQRAMGDERAMIYAFGETWGPEPKADAYFGFKPGRGIHDIHMNQGNPPGRFANSNGNYQDGGLIFEFPDDNGATLWVAVFLKFQSQAWHTEEGTDPALPPGTPIPTPDPGPGIPPHDAPDGLIRIIAALANDTASPERETVTLLNTSDIAIDLAGWALLDKNKHRQPLTGSIPGGETLRIALVGTGSNPVQLSNKGGIITLVNDSGLKVHGVAYTAEQARQPGRTIPFQ